MILEIDDKKLTRAESVEYLKRNNCRQMLQALAEIAYADIEELQGEIHKLERHAEFLGKIARSTIKFFGKFVLIVEDEGAEAMYWSVGTDVHTLSSIQKDEDGTFSVRHMEDVRKTESDLQILASGCPTYEEAEKVLEDKFVSLSG